MSDNLIFFDDDFKDLTNDVINETNEISRELFENVQNLNAINIMINGMLCEHNESIIKLDTSTKTIEKNIDNANKQLVKANDNNKLYNNYLLYLGAATTILIIPIGGFIKIGILGSLICIKASKILNKV